MPLFKRESDTDKIKELAQGLLEQDLAGVTPAMALSMAEMQFYGPSKYEKRGTHASVILEKYGWTEVKSIEDLRAAQMREEVSRRGFRTDAEAMGEARQAHGGRVSPCPTCGGPKAMDLKPKQVRYWLRLTLNRASGGYGLACSNCGSEEPLPAGMLDWAVQSVAGVNKAVGPER